MDRRAFVRASALALAGVACSRKKAPALRTMQTLRSELAARGIRSGLQVFPGGQDYLSARENYLALGLVDAAGRAMAGARAQVWMARASEKPIGPVDLSWFPYAKYGEGPPGVHAANVTFPAPGNWELLVAAAGSQGSAFVAAGATGATLIPGARALATQTPTRANHRGVDPICTRAPACPFHEISLADAIRSGKPVAFQIGTPKFCQSRTCGPNLDELIAVSKTTGARAHFVHAEVYRDDKPDTIQHSIVSPTFLAWHLPSEPWLFLIDRGGVIRERFEGPVTASQIRTAFAPQIA